MPRRAVASMFATMNERPTIDLDRSAGEFLEVPRGPLDRPRVLYAGLAVSGVLMLVDVIMMVSYGAPWILAVCGLVPAIVFGGCLVGRFPAYFFRRDRT